MKCISTHKKLLKQSILEPATLKRMRKNKEKKVQCVPQGRNRRYFNMLCSCQSQCLVKNNKSSNHSFSRVKVERDRFISYMWKADGDLKHFGVDGDRRQDLIGKIEIVLIEIKFIGHLVGMLCGGIGDTGVFPIQADIRSYSVKSVKEIIQVMQALTLHTTAIQTICG